MSGTIFVVNADNELVEMSQEHFAKEADFQKLLADHPKLLRLAAGTSGELLLVRQECPIAQAQGGTDRWNIDHLFVTREGVPVLVEVKRASDTRGRREVVAQMLDYASHGAIAWTGEYLCTKFRDTATSYGHDDPDQYLREFLGEEDPETFWRRVVSNLGSGRIRMVFVSDRISDELRRIVEWLNEQLRYAEVLAIEIAQFTNPNGYRTLVPELVGATARAELAKTVAPQNLLLEDTEWIDRLENDFGPKVKELIELFEDAGYKMRRTQKQKSASFTLRDSSRKDRALFFFYDSGTIAMDLGAFAYFPELVDEHWRKSLLDRLEELVPGFKRSPAGTASQPTFTLQAISPPDIWNGFKTLVNEIADRLKG